MRLLSRIRLLALALAVLIALSALVTTSQAGNDQWTFLNQTGYPPGAQSIIGDPTGRMYISADQLYVSVDAGNSWALLPMPEPQAPAGRVVAVDPHNSSRVFAYQGWYLYSSTDGGTHWAQSWSSGIQSIRSVLISPSDSQTVYMALSGSEALPGFAKSVDGGGTWVTSGPQLPCDWLLIHPANRNWLYLNCSYPPYSTSPDRPGLYKSIDGGASWSWLRDDSFLRGITTKPDGSTLLYGARDQYVVTSSDEGATWQPAGDIGTRWATSIVVDPTNPAAIYVGTGDQNAPGVYYSSNYGANWLPLSAGMGQRQVSALYVGANTPKLLLASTVDGALWSYTMISPPSQPPSVTPTPVLATPTPVRGLPDGFHAHYVCRDQATGDLRDTGVDSTLLAPACPKKWDEIQMLVKH